MIYALQAGAIVWRTIAMTSDLTERDGKMPNFAGIAVIMMVVVAFTTAELTNLCAWAYGQLQGLPFRAGRGVGALRHAVAPQRAIQRHDGEADSAFGAQRLGREGAKGRTHLRISE